MFCHKCGGKFPHQSLGASGGKGPPQPRRRSAPRLRDQRTYSEAAQSAEPQQPFPPQSQSEPLQTQDPPSAPQVRSVKAKELTAVDKARAMLAATASTYGPDSAEYTEAANKLRKLKHEQLQAKSLPQQIRSLQDQIASGKKRWWKGEEEQEWISQEISRLCARYDSLFAQNDRLGDEIEELEAQLTVAEKALHAHPEFQPLQPGKQQQQPAPPKSPEAIADLVRTVYVALQSSQLPGVTQVSSDALSAVLAEISAAQHAPASQSSQPQSSANSSEPSAQTAVSDGAAQPRPRWGDNSPIDEDEENPEDLDDPEDQDPEGMEDVRSEPFVEGAGEPPYTGDDPTQFESEGLYLSRRCRAGNKAISKSKVLSKFQSSGRSDPSHRGPGAFAAIRAAQRQSAKESG